MPGSTPPAHPAQPDPLSPQAQAILDAPDQPRLRGEPTLAMVQRQRADQAAARRPVIAAVQRELGVTAQRAVIAGVPVVELEPARRTGPGRALYLHGGGFTGGLAHDMTSVLMTDALGLPVTSIDYDLAPYAPFPVALEQAVDVATATMAGDGDRDRDRSGDDGSGSGSGWVIFGVSAGATLVLSLMKRLRQEGRPLPAAVGLFTPWTDLTGAGDSRTANDGRDPVLRWVDELPLAARAYAGAAPLHDPLVSPAFAEVGPWFPPSIITTGTRDLFLSDCTRLYWALRRAGARTELRVWENLWHAFNTQPGVPEAAEAREEVAAFLRAELDRAAPGA